MCKSPGGPVNPLGPPRVMGWGLKAAFFSGVIFKMFLLHWITLEGDGNDKGEQIRCQTDGGEHRSEARIKGRGTVRTCRAVECASYSK